MKKDMTDKMNQNKHYHNKNDWRRLIAVLALIAAMIAGGAVSVFADDLDNTVPTGEAEPFYSGTIETGFVPNGYNPPTTTYGPGFGPHSVDGVYQSLSTTSPTSFAAGLPLGTIFIDQSKIGAKTGDVEFVSRNPQILAGLCFVNDDDPDNRDYHKVAYDGRKDGAFLLVPNIINRLDGDLFTVTYTDAAIKPADIYNNSDIPNDSDNSSDSSNSDDSDNSDIYNNSHSLFE